MINKIGVFRKKADLNQTEFGDLLGWGQSRVGNYESGYRDPGLDECRAIVAALNETGKVNVTLDDVFPPQDRVAA